MKIKITSFYVFSVMCVFCSNLAFAQSSDFEGAVWYEIFVERFRNAIPGNDPIKAQVVVADVGDWQVHPWASNWYKLQIWEIERNSYFSDIIEDRRFGGDLLGISDRLRYLKAIGVDVIDLSPVFESPSALKNASTSLHHVDHNFGYDRAGDWKQMQSETQDSSGWDWTTADRALADLVFRAHLHEIKVILQVTFDHCSQDFWAFKDLEENQQESEYRDWFEVLYWDDPATPDTIEFDYKSVGGDKGFPLFKQDANGPVQPVKEYIFASTRRWMELRTERDEPAAIDGWHIKNVSVFPDKFWQTWHEFVYEINPDIATFGEGDNSTLWLENAGFRITSDPEWLRAVHDFFYKDSVSVSFFDNELARLRKKKSFDHSVINRVGGFELGRIASLIKNAKHKSSGTSDPTPPTEEERQIQKLLTIFQMTYIGSPIILYGDEGGMWGCKPDHLKPMLWDGIVYENESYDLMYPKINEKYRNRFNQEVFALYRKLIALRHEHPAIRSGLFKVNIVDDERKIYSYSRQLDEDEVSIVLNLDSQPHEIELPVAWSSKSKMKEILGDKQYKIYNEKITLTVAAMSGAILEKN